jgi:multiple sugar transport system substrate-binding protein
MLGGTGVAVSKLSAHPSEAIAYAKWLASPEHQRGLYFREGGQPASLAAWSDSAVNAEADGFFSGTLETLQSAYLRPRFDGFVRFFEAAGIEINRCLRGDVTNAALIRWLNKGYATQRVTARQIAQQEEESA